MNGQRSRERGDAAARECLQSKRGVWRGVFVSKDNLCVIVSAVSDYWVLLKSNVSASVGFY